jgi:hypothetical protein
MTLPRNLGFADLTIGHRVHGPHAEPVPLLENPRVAFLEITVRHQPIEIEASHPFTLTHPVEAVQALRIPAAHTGPSTTADSGTADASHIVSQSSGTYHMIVIKPVTRDPSTHARS